MIRYLLNKFSVIQALMPVILVGISTLVVGCGEKQESMSSFSEWQGMNGGNLSSFNEEEPYKNFVYSNKEQQTQEEAKTLKERLMNSYARLAANQPDVCPKLLQKSVDSSRIVRHQDVMVDDYCDYFIYPAEGQKLDVVTFDSTISKLLVAPTLYDFTNGFYMVKNTDKHVIRLKYDGIQRKPSRFSYDVEVIIH